MKKIISSLFIAGLMTASVSCLKVKKDKADDSSGLDMTEVQTTNASNSSNHGSNNLTPAQKPQAKKLRAEVLYDDQLSQITLQPQYGNDYWAENLLDGNKNNCWSIGAMEFYDYEYMHGNVKPHLNIGFNGDEVEYAEIKNGYIKSDKVYHMNSRPRSVKVYAYRNGSSSPVGTLYSGVLKDSKSTQKLQFARLKQPYDYIQFVFDFYDVYPGNKYSDLCISDLKLYGF